jgi:hypothetical protein
MTVSRKDRLYLVETGLVLKSARKEGAATNHGTRLSLGLFQIAHDKLPDVLAYSSTKNWMFSLRPSLSESARRD